MCVVKRLFISLVIYSVLEQKEIFHPANKEKIQPLQPLHQCIFHTKSLTVNIAPSLQYLSSVSVGVGSSRVIRLMSDEQISMFSHVYQSLILISIQDWSTGSPSLCMLLCSCTRVSQGQSHPCRFLLAKPHAAFCAKSCFRFPFLFPIPWFSSCPCSSGVELHWLPGHV